MSEFYKNKMAERLKLRIDRDYIFLIHKVSSEKAIQIDHKYIMSLDAISDLSKPDRSNALKQVFVDLTSKAD